MFWNARHTVWGMEFGPGLGSGVYGGAGASYTWVTKSNGSISANLGRVAWDLAGGGAGVLADLPELLRTAHREMRRPRKTC